MGGQIDQSVGDALFDLVGEVGEALGVKVGEVGEALEIREAILG